MRREVLSAWNGGYVSEGYGGRECCVSGIRFVFSAWERWR